MGLETRHPPAPFIVGAIRSGTTLLRLMLDAHPELAIPPETGFPAGFLEKAAGAESDRAALSAELAAMERFQEWGMDQGAVASLLPDGRFPVADGLRSFYRGYARRFGKARWGDKSPSHINVMPQLAALLPEARFIHIIRDGRDTLISQRDAKAGLFRNADRPARQHAMYWQRCIRGGRAQARGLPHYLEVRYESLVTDTEAVLRQVCDFLEIGFDPAMLQYHARAEDRLAELGARVRADGSVQSADERRAIFALTRQPPDASRIGRWRERLPETDLHDFELGAGKMLGELGYALAAPGPGEAPAITAAREKLLAQPGKPELHFALGVCHERSRNIDRALACFLAAQALSPDPARYQARCAHTLERLGRYGEAWERLALIARRDVSGVRPWDGEALEGRRILMRRRYRHIGAEIRQARFIGCVAAAAAACTVATEPRLVALLARSFPAARVVPLGHADSSHELEMSYEDAASLFGRTGGSIERSFAPLVADPALARELEGRYRAGARRLVGISWHSTNARKQLPAIGDWRPLLGAEGHRFVSLQYGDTGQDVAALSALSRTPVLADPSVDQLADMDRFAAQIAALDAVVTISCTAAHLAGAMGKPTVVLLHEDEKLTWPCEGDSSPWYPSVRLMRRRPGETWRDVIEAAKKLIEPQMNADERR